MAGPEFVAISLDLGTTAIKAALLSQDGKLSNVITRVTPEIKVDKGRYESNACHYAETVEQVLAECLEIAGRYVPLGLCNQRSSFLIWEKISGHPLTPLISWQDNRGIPCCETMRALDTRIHRLTGLRLTPYYFAPKLSVLLQRHPEWRQRLVQGDWLVGTLDSFLIWRWTSGRFHITDASMAARTLLMDIKTQAWSTTLCEYFAIPSSVLPQIKPSVGLNLRLNNGLILQASLGDQSAALIASIDEARSEALVNLGTGGFVMRYRVAEENKLDGYLRTLVYLDNTGYSHVAMEGTLNSISAALASYPVNQCRFKDLAANDIFCVAEPSGIGAPFFRHDLGIVYSRSVDHLTKKQVAALLLEAIIFRVAQILEDFHDALPITHVYLSGGLSAIPCLQQGIAQCVPFKISWLQQKESSLLGAAMLAAGLMVMHQREENNIAIISRRIDLYEKYQRWKGWLDTLLNG